MTLVNTETGEVVEELTRDAAERLSERIALRLDTIADNYVAVMPMIREAITRQAHAALGYRSPGDYVRDRFGNALSRLGVEVRREVVRELTEAGLSTRAIAPVVGASQQVVHNDIKVTNGLSPDQTPEPAEEGEADAGPGHAPAGEQAPNPVPEAASPVAPGGAVDQPRPPVTGIDGKRYTRPEPKPAPLRTAEQQNAEEFAVRFAGQILSLQSMQYDHMRATALRQWGAGQAAVSPVQRPYASPEHIRVAARGLLALADEWEQCNV